MVNVEKYAKTLELLTGHSQQHLLGFYENLDENAQKALLDQIDALDFDSIPAWIEKYVKGEYSLDIPENLAPSPYFPALATDTDTRARYDQAKALGADLISQGKVAAFVVAGGQGTRLGFDGPKGDYPTSPIKNKTLFQLFAEQIKAVSKKYSAPIPWYIMTSPLNYSQTVDSFEKSDYFGLDKADVIFFQQGTLPNFAFDGKVLLANKGEIATSPDGHGGSLKALHDSGAIEDMKKRGIEQISYFQVDNPLVKAVDPLFIGLHAQANAGMSSKTVIKANPTEKVGNFCLADGKVTVIEYSDLADEQANKTNPDGSLVFELGSIAIHLISRAFVEDLNAGRFSLPIHKAVKKIPCLGAAGNHVNPTEPNGVKLETFVFDALPLSSESIILETLRSEEFAPVKNATGVDSVEVTKKMMTQRAANWLEAAGIEIPKNPDGSIDCTIEMASSFALDADDVIAKVNDVLKINSGETLYLE
jgi:UDP-N-acetylglucosamine/UDP-N-acetylgalactosamine diphosphorylase